MFVCTRPPLVEVVCVNVVAFAIWRARRAFRLLVLLALAGAGSAEASSSPRVDAALPEPPCRLAYTSLDRVVPLVGGAETPQLLLAQRAIERDLDGTPADQTPYTTVDIPGWKSVGGAAAMSLVVPGTGQLYAGSKRGYLYLGIEAAALIGYATFNSKSDDTRAEFYSYVGDPNDAASRFSFDRLGASVSSEEVARLRTIYEKDKAEFYDTVTKVDTYANGWAQTDMRVSAVDLSDEMDSQGHKSDIAFYTLIANHIVSAVDALNIARLTNHQLREDLTLKLKLKPGAHGSYAFTLTQKF